MNEKLYPKIYLYRRLVQAKLFIDAHFAENIDLGNIADEACFSKFHFIRQFKKIYLKTPHQYLMSVRIQKATELLKTDITVSDVCYAIGFESVGSFCQLFKLNMGKTPSCFQNDYKLKKEQILRSPLLFIPGCFAEKHGWLEKTAIFNK